MKAMLNNRIAVILLLLIILTLAGYGTNEPGNAREGDMVSHNVDPLPPMDVREYMAAYGEANEAFIKAAEQVAGTFSSDELGSRAWFDASLKRMQQMKEAIKPFRQLSPPEEFQEAHELIQTSMNSYEQGLISQFKAWKKRILISKDIMSIIHKPFYHLMKAMNY